ncbi:MAG: aspartate aminotransferase family protein [Desulfatiglandaceae bacterium]
MENLKRDYLFYQTRKKLPFIKKAKGIYMWDHAGKEYIDACSGAVICNIGYGNPRIADAIAEQAHETFFAYRTQFENEPAVRLATELVAYSAPHLNRVFYVSGGSEAVESAMKLCRQYFYNRGEGSRYLFISRTPSYHGSTLGALALTSYAPLEIPFRSMIRTYPKVPAPYCYRCVFHKEYPHCDLECARALETTILKQGRENVAAFVVEPIVGASIGALVPPEDYFSVIQKTCRKYGIFLILDEVMTGFGRTGKLFAYEHWDIEADIVALSKGMASGYYPLGAIMARDSIVDEVVSKGGFAHGHTYAGNPMACAVGLEVFRIIREEHLSENAARMGRVLKAGLKGLEERYEMIGQIRGKGLLLALELVKDRDTREPFPAEKDVNLLLTDEAYDEGLIIYPRKPINGLTGDHVLVAPPLIVNEDQVHEIISRLDRALKRTMKKL